MESFKNVEGEIQSKEVKYLHFFKEGIKGQDSFGHSNIKFCPTLFSL